MKNGNGIFVKLLLWLLTLALIPAANLDCSAQKEVRTGEPFTTDNGLASVMSGDLLGFQPDSGAGERPSVSLDEIGELK